MANETFQLDSFAVTVCDIADADVKALHALSLSVGWPHRAEDWQFMLGIGRGLVALDESGRVHGSAMWFPFGADFATVGMVIVTPLLQKHGGGQRLMRLVLEQAKGRALGLQATDQSHQLFLSLGFVDEGTIYLRQGHVDVAQGVTPLSDADIREVREADLQDLRNLDRLATGHDRGALMDALVARSRGLTLRRGGRLEALALIRPFGRGSVIGPVIAASEADAIGVVAPLLAAQQGRFVRMDVGAASGRLTDLLDQCGLPVCDTVTRMSLGRPWRLSAGAEPAMYALASHATG